MSRKPPGIYIPKDQHARPLLVLIDTLAGNMTIWPITNISVDGNAAKAICYAEVGRSP